MTTIEASGTTLNFKLEGQNSSLDYFIQGIFYCSLLLMGICYNNEGIAILTGLWVPVNSEEKYYKIRGRGSKKSYRSFCMHVAGFISRTCKGRYFMNL